MFVRSLLFAALCVTTTAAVLPAQDGPHTVRLLVRADGKNAATLLTADTIHVQFNGHDTPIQALRPLMGTGEAPEIAVLIDDSLRGNFGNQVDEIRKSVQSLASAGASVAVGYMQNGRVVFGSNPFRKDPDTVAQTLRLPLSGAGITGSPYFCLQDAIKRWPSSSHAPRVVLMITNGIDLYNGPPAQQNQDSPYVQQALQDAQRAGIPVYSIYYGRFDNHPGFGSFSGQSYLGQVADETGAETFNQGSLNPPSIAPFLQQFERDLRATYVLSFQTDNRKLEQVKLKSTAGQKLRVQHMAQAN